MKFHADMWVAVAASAPVIALASVVGLEGTLEIGSSLLLRRKRLRRTRPRLTNSEFKIKRGQQLVRASIGQVMTLVFALVSLGEGHDVLPPVLVAYGEGLGLVAVAGAAMAKVWSRGLALRIDEDLTRPLPRAEWPGSAEVPS